MTMAEGGDFSELAQITDGLDVEPELGTLFEKLAEFEGHFREAGSVPRFIAFWIHFLAVWNFVSMTWRILVWLRRARIHFGYGLD